MCYFSKNAQEHVLNAKEIVTLRNWMIQGWEGYKENKEKI